MTPCQVPAQLPVFVAMPVTVPVAPLKEETKPKATVPVAPFTLETPVTAPVLPLKDVTGVAFEEAATRTPEEETVRFAQLYVPEETPEFASVVVMAVAPDPETAPERVIVWLPLM